MLTKLRHFRPRSSWLIFCALFAWVTLFTLGAASSLFLID